MSIREAWEHLGGTPLDPRELRRLTIAVNDAAVLEQAVEGLEKAREKDEPPDLSAGQAAVLRSTLKAMKDDGD